MQLFFHEATIMIRSGLDWLLGLLRWITVWSIQYACYRVWSCLWMCMHVMVIYVMYVNGCACAMILITSRWSTGQWYISSHLCYRVLFILKSNGCSSDKTSPCACLIVDMARLCRNYLANHGYYTISTNKWWTIPFAAMRCDGRRQTVDGGTTVHEGWATDSVWGSTTH